MDGWKAYGEKEWKFNVFFKGDISLMLPLHQMKTLCIISYTLYYGDTQVNLNWCSNKH